MLTSKKTNKKNQEDEKREDKWALILHNDDVNTFDHVINQLVSYCDHTPIQAEQCALITHYKGKCDVLLGEINTLKPIKSQLEQKALKVTIDCN